MSPPLGEAGATGIANGLESPVADERSLLAEGLVSDDVRFVLDALGCADLSALRAGLALGDHAHLAVPRRPAKRLLAAYRDALIGAMGELENESEERTVMTDVADRLLEETDWVVRSPENAEQKARRYLAEGRLTLINVRPADGYVVASCRGSAGAVYSLGYDPAKSEWRCTCPSPGRARCSHLAALRIVVGR